MPKLSNILSIFIFIVYGATAQPNDTCSSTLDNDVSSIPVIDVREELIHHADELFHSPEIIKVAIGVYVAIGYDLANTIIIESKTGITIIDTLSETSIARQVFDDYKMRRIYGDKHRTQSQMKIEGIILTHYHTDHSMGIGFWRDINTENGFDLIPTIYAHQYVIDEFKRFFLYSFNAIKDRSMRQFGIIINYNIDPEIIESRNLFFGLGIGAHINENNDTSFIDLSTDENTILFNDDTFDIEIGSLSLTLIYAPGETKDHTAIYYSDQKVLFVGDNIYYAFPNLYSIRGTTPRDPKIWINALETFLEYDTRVVVGSHSRPVYGRDNIKQEIILYRDLIAFVHDQTVRYMSKRYRIHDIVTKIEESLPDILKGGRKQEFYGTIEWSVRSIYDMYLGYFQGDSAELYPSNFYDRGNGLLRVMKQLYGDKGSEEEMIEFLVNYLDELIDEAEANRDDSKYIQIVLNEERWILEMVTSLLTYYDADKECDLWLKLSELRWKILQKSAGKSISTIGRNYFLSQYLEERFNFNVEDLEFDPVTNHISVEWILEALKFKIKPEMILLDGDYAIEYITNLKFNDSGLMYQLKIRNGGVFTYEEYSKYNQEIINEYDDNASLIYQFDEIHFKLKELFNMDYIIKGGYIEASAFWFKFE